jgi:hypothetical protein
LVVEVLDHGEEEGNDTEHHPEQSGVKRFIFDWMPSLQA